MSETRGKRAWLAAVLAATVTGLGHVYLWRLRRALGWLTVAVAVGFLTLPQGLDPGAAGTEVLPLLGVSAVSTVDAYRLARATGSTDAAGDTTPDCPDCGRELDPDVEFCPWCSTRLDDTA